MGNAVRLLPLRSNPEAEPGVGSRKRSGTKETESRCTLPRSLSAIFGIVRCLSPAPIAITTDVVRDSGIYPALNTDTLEFYSNILMVQIHTICMEETF